MPRRTIKRANPLATYKINRATAEKAFSEKYSQMHGKALIQMFRENVKAKGLSYDARKIQTQINELEQKKLKASQIRALKEELIKFFVKNGMNEVQY